ncbi:hypothetical protein [Clostridium perfringens]|uniref:hypothetical protein n=1 Tax=Clostridium perfringens TaxID=1502 RepID=UPI00096A40C9|nr:hypothetical protein [Clostridium perfringens]
MPKILNRVGEKRKNSYGTEMIIIGYINSLNIIVEFKDKHKYRSKTTYSAFKNGNVSNPYDKTICDIGCLGIGNHTERKLILNQKAYKCWKGILERCYNFKKYNYHRNYVYEECQICDNWLVFNNFADWFDMNYYEIENRISCLDKDIISKGNKIYSPETCIFVPDNINKLFTKSNKIRGGLPIGVSSEGSKFRASISTNCIIGKKEGKSKEYLGSYNTPEEAFEAYKKFKENYIKKVADYYKDRIPKKLYDAMYGYEIHIDD